MSMIMWLFLWGTASLVFLVGCAIGAAMNQRRSWETAREAGYLLGFEVGQHTPPGKPPPDLWMELHLDEAARSTP